MPKFNVRRAVVSAGLCSALALGGTSLALANEPAPDPMPNGGGQTQTEYYKITFEVTDPATDEVVEPTSDMREAGASYVDLVPSITGQEGWTFAGWKADDGTIYSADQLQYMTAVRDITFTTHWEKDDEPQQPVSRLNITFKDSMGADFGTWSETASTWNWNPEANGARSYDGYTFAGWSETPDGEVLEANAFDTRSGDVTLWAVWTKDETPISRLNITFKDSMGADFGTWSETASTWNWNPEANGARSYDGYTFAGWSETPDGEVLEANAFDTRSGDVTLWAVWTKDETPATEHTFTFVVKDPVTNEVLDSKAVVVEHDETVTEIPQFDIKGYTITGWTVDGFTYTPATEVYNIHAWSDLTLEAELKAVETDVIANVTYRDSMSDYSWTQTVENGSGWYFDLSESRPELVPEGYEFAGWTFDKEGNDPATDEKMATLGGDVTLYAQWKQIETPAQTVTVKFQITNPGTDTVLWSYTDDKHVAGELVTSIPQIGDKNGYTCIGWQTEDGTIYDLEQVKSFYPTNDLTFTTVWEKTEAPVAIANLYYRDSMGDWSWGPSTIENGEGWYFDLAEDIVSHEGYKFVGWSLDAQGGELLKDGDLATTSGDVTLYAQWEKVEDEASHLNVFYKDSLDPEYSWTWTGAPADDWWFDPSENGSGAMIHEGYEFAGWTYDLEGTLPAAEDDLVTTTGDVTVYAQWKAVDESSHLNIIYKDSLDDEYSWTWTGAPANDWWFDPSENGSGAMIHEGYTFAGWSFNKDGEIISEDALATTTGDVTLYAVWIKNEDPITLHTVTFIDEENGTTTVQTVEDGATVAEPEDPTLDGYTFAGWTLEGAAYDFATPVTSDLTLKASWTPNETPVAKEYTVTFQGEGVETSTVKVKEGETVAKPETPARDGYTFVAWTVEGGAAYDFTTPVTSDLTLTASWKANETPVDPVETHTVTFVNKEAGTSTIQTVEDGKAVEKPADPTAEGKTFVAWTDADGNAYDFATPVTGDLTLYAQFKDAETPVDPANPTTPDDGNKDDGKKDDSKKDESKAKNELPKTADETSTAGVAAAGIAGVAALGAGATLLNRRKREQN